MTLAKRSKQGQVVGAVGVFDRDRVDRGGVQRRGQVEIGFRGRLDVIFLVQVLGVTAADVDNTGHRRGQAVEAALQVLDAEIECLARVAGEQRFVDLICDGSRARPTPAPRR